MCRGCVMNGELERRRRASTRARGHVSELRIWSGDAAVSFEQFGVWSGRERRRRDLVLGRERRRRVMGSRVERMTTSGVRLTGDGTTADDAKKTTQGWRQRWREGFENEAGAFHAGIRPHAGIPASWGILTGLVTIATMVFCGHVDAIGGSKTGIHSINLISRQRGLQRLQQGRQTRHWCSRAVNRVGSDFDVSSYSILQAGNLLTRWWCVLFTESCLRQPYGDMVVTSPLLHLIVPHN
ncbi:hypothetical protein PIB30_072198 [Stylosanthes scabra]|uniref:Uncharacterized protein n=1 Tax=Stylosanthes scabra TaxID=79078 RepID=A0ABU6YNE3_9FABA|nr:hypothetical protein [Stylosanthes scabra]